MSEFPRFYVVSEGDGCETWMWGDDALLVPSATLDEERKQQFREGDTDKIFKHGGDFPAITLSEVLGLLEKNGLLDPLLERCSRARKGLDQDGGE